jgi:hypothetical protein
MNMKDKYFLLEENNLFREYIFMKSNLSKEFMDLSLTMLICILKIFINIMKTFFRVI